VTRYRPAMIRWLLAAVLVLVGGCGSSASEDLARRAADEFVSAAASGDSDRACSLLTERAREDCAEFTSPGGTVEEVEVWGDAAMAHTSAGTLFLRELSDGWHVSGAGCHPVPDRPYSCEVGGP
jgi:hypothetical protein